MKLAHYAAGQAGASWGIVSGTHLIDVPDLCGSLGEEAPRSILALLADERLDWLRCLVASAPAEILQAASVAMSDVKLLAPIPAPGKIIGIGRNYKDHADEAALVLPRWPKLFPKFNSTIVGPGDAVVRPAMTQQLDFEVELGVVIGRAATAVSEETAMSYVAGYTVLNDVSARDVQFADEQLTLGKNFATFCPMGPVVTTADDLADPTAIELILRLNGREMQHATTNQLIFSIPYLIAFISHVLSLHPGDIISTGTPSGVGCFRSPPVWLEPGDIMESEVIGIGTLINPIAQGNLVVPISRPDR